MEDHKALKPSAVIDEFSDTIQRQIDNLFANGVVTTSIVVRSILLAEMSCSG